MRRPLTEKRADGYNKPKAGDKMNWLDKIERKMGRHYIPNLMKYLCIIMAGLFILKYLPGLNSAYSLLRFDRARILQGEVWRVITFIFLPPDYSLIGVILSLYFYYFLGTALESRWGSARFNLYYLLGVIGNIVSGFILGYATNTYLNTSLLLAFAIYYPDFQFLLFFFLPIKVKWIGWLAAAGLIYELIVGTWPMRAALLFSLLPVAVFFGKQGWLQLKMDIRKLQFRMKMRK